jgi:hypothetical protein
MKITRESQRAVQVQLRNENRLQILYLQLRDYLFVAAAAWRREILYYLAD